MKINFEVKACGTGLDVWIKINGNLISITSFKASDDIEPKIPELVAKAKSNVIRALALENALNAAVQS